MDIQLEIHPGGIGFTVVGRRHNRDLVLEAEFHTAAEAGSFVAAFVAAANQES